MLAAIGPLRGIGAVALGLAIALATSCASRAPIPDADVAPWPTSPGDGSDVSASYKNILPRESIRVLSEQELALANQMLRDAAFVPLSDEAAVRIFQIDADFAKRAGRYYLVRSLYGLNGENGYQIYQKGSHLLVQYSSLGVCNSPVESAILVKLEVEIDRVSTVTDCAM